MIDDIDYSRAEKGRKESLDGTIQQGRYHVELYMAVRSELNRRGFTELDYARLIAVIAALDTQDARRHEARDTARTSLAAENEARTELKRIKRDLDSSLVDLFAEGIDVGVNRSAFDAGHALGNSTPKVSAYFGRIDAVLAKVADRLAPYNDGRNLHAEAQEAKSRLDLAQASQEVGVRQLPEETVKIHALKGEAFDLIEKFNRAGKRAFAGQAQKISLFNKDLILRARKKKKTTQESATGT